MRADVHKMLVWLPRATFTGAIALSAVWDGFRDAMAHYFTEWIVLMASPYVGGIILAICVGYIFLIWWTGRSVKTRPGFRGDMLLSEAYVYLLKDSAWAAKRPKDDDSWPFDGDDALRGALSRKEIVSVGRRFIIGKHNARNAEDYIPSSFLQSANWDYGDAINGKMVSEFWHTGDRAPIRENTIEKYLDVKLDRSQVMALWPRRSFWARLCGNSPLDRAYKLGSRHVKKCSD